MVACFPVFLRIGVDHHGQYFLKSITLGFPDHQFCLLFNPLLVTETASVTGLIGGALAWHVQEDPGSHAQQGIQKQAEEPPNQSKTKDANSLCSILSTPFFSSLNP